MRGAAAALGLALALSAPAGAEHQIRCENPAVFTPTISFYNASDCHIARYPIPGCNVKTDPHVCTKRGTGITYDIACPRSGANDPLRESWVAEAWRQFTAFYSLTPCPAIEHGESRVGGESSSSGGGGSNESGGSDSSESGGGGSNESGGGGDSESGKSGAGSFGGGAGLGLALLVLWRRARRHQAAALALALLMFPPAADAFHCHRFWGNTKYTLIELKVITAERRLKECISFLKDGRSSGFSSCSEQTAI